MALIKCPDCNKEMSDQAPACPNCGRPNAAAGPAAEVGTKCPKCGKTVRPIVTSVGGGSCSVGSRETWSCPACGKVIRKKGCFVATATYGDEDRVEVQFLRAFRDTVLQRSVVGRAATRAYYGLGPYLAAPIERVPVLKRLARKVLDQTVNLIERTTTLRRRNFRDGKSSD